ncbi:MAG TPA: alpha/beta hydrolase [Myxococcota bacterium]|nr:alpha/beta hydrolase [Myxococcota bacterium]
MEKARAMLAHAERRRLRLEQRGIELALLDWGGDRPLALLHHATGFCKGIWAPVAEALRERFRVIALDARGHGDSSQLEGAAAYAWPEFARDLEAAADALAAQHGPVALGIGHSFGGTAMLSAGRARPDLFERLVLVDPVMPQASARSAEGENPLAAGARRRRTEWPSLAAARASWGERRVFRAWPPEVLDLYALDGLREGAGGSVTLKCPSSVEAAIFDQGRAVDAAELAADHPVRALWLRASYGSFDGKWCRMLAGSMRACELVELAADHLVVMEQPALVAEQALRFASGL